MQIAGQPPSVSRRAVLELVAGAVLIAAGAVTLVVVSDDSGYVIGGAPIFAGLVVVLHGMSGLTGYKSYVAWRYLLNHRQRVTPRVKLMIAVGGAALGALYGAGQLDIPGLDPELDRGLDPWNPLQAGLLLGVLYLLVVVFWGVLRHSKPSMITFLFGVVVFALGVVGGWLVQSGKVESRGAAPHPPPRGRPGGPRRRPGGRPPGRPPTGVLASSGAAWAWPASRCCSAACAPSSPSSPPSRSAACGSARPRSSPCSP